MVDFDLSENRQQKERDIAIAEIEKLITERRNQRQFVISQTKEFTERLFEALKMGTLHLRDRGLTELGEPRMVEHPAGNGRQALQISIEDWSIIFVPLVGVARPNIRDEAQIPGIAFKQICGRVAVFIGNDPAEEAFYDFLILSDGSWFAWGYGWPRQASTIEETDFETLAYAMLNSFMKDIFVTWRPRRETTLGAAMDARKRPYVFGLPGDEH
jgi:hypothetical protein